MTTDSIKRRLEYKRDRLDKFKTSPNKAIDTRLSDLTDGINKTKPQSLDPNRSMHTHLRLLKRGIERDSEAWVAYRISALTEQINALEAELEGK